MKCYGKYYLILSVRFHRYWVQHFVDKAQVFCVCLVAHKPMTNMSTYKLSTSTRRVACKSKPFSCIHAYETGWKSGFHSCLIPSCQTFSAGQELNIGTKG